MKCVLIGTIENVNSYEGKNGFGATISMSTVENKRREIVEFNTKDKELAEGFEEALQENATVEIQLIQNKFGLRFGDITSFVVA